MGIDEIIRTVAYTVIIPGAAYTGVKVWNAHIMPEHLRRPVAVFLFTQSAIYTLLMAGLLLTHLYRPMPPLLWLNTVFIFSQAVTVTVVALRLSRLRNALLSVAFVVVTALLLIG